MQALIHLKIVSVLSEIYTHHASLVVLPGIQGELGILPGHAPMLSRLKPGNIRVTTAEKTIELVYVSGGLVEVQPNEIIVLADSAFRTRLMAEEAAEEARRQTKEAMEAGAPMHEFGHFYSALFDSVAQLRTLSELRKASGHSRGMKAP